MSNKLTHVEVDGDFPTPTPWAVFGSNTEEPPTMMRCPPYIVMCKDTKSGAQMVDGRDCIPIAAFCVSWTDAVLVSAAPDLLAACKLAETYHSLKGGDGKGEADLRDALGIGPRDHMGRAIAEVRRAAIAKAEGGADHV